MRLEKPDTETLHAIACKLAEVDHGRLKKLKQKADKTNNLSDKLAFILHSLQPANELWVLRTAVAAQLGNTRVRSWCEWYWDNQRLGNSDDEHLLRLSYQVALLLFMRSRNAAGKLGKMRKAVSKDAETLRDSTGAVDFASYPLIANYLSEIADNYDEGIRNLPPVSPWIM